MSFRISTAGFYTQNLTSLSHKQIELARTQRQMSSGLRIERGADDPVAAGTAVSLDRTLASLTRFARNADVLQHRLGLAESSLASAGDQLARVRELAVQANNATQSDSSRAAIAAEMREAFDALVALANSSDGAGGHLFAGTSGSSPPFLTSGSSVNYVGDATQRRIDIGPDAAVADVDSGDAVFMQIRGGDGRTAVRADAANSGTAVLRRATLSDPAAWDGGSYRISFDAGNFEVRDGGGALLQSGAFVPGQAISVRGVDVVIDGAPADGDAFDLQAAPTRDVFAILQSMIAAVETPGTSASDRAERQNAMYAAMEDLARAQDHLIDRRAALGARLARVDDEAARRDGESETLATSLSQLRDLDYAEAASRLSLQLTALEAAQQSFLRIQGLSLFDLLR